MLIIFSLINFLCNIVVYEIKIIVLLITIVSELLSADGGIVGLRRTASQWVSVIGLLLIAGDLGLCGHLVGILLREAYVMMQPLCYVFDRGGLVSTHVAGPSRLAFPDVSLSEPERSFSTSCLLSHAFSFSLREVSVPVTQHTIGGVGKH